MRNTPKILPSALLFFAAATPSSADFLYDLESGGTFQFYGQVDPAYLTFDDGVSSTGALVDNTNSNTRVGFWYRNSLDTGEFSVNLETAFGLRPSAGLSQNHTPDGLDWKRTNIRKVEAIWKDDRWGTFYAGQGSMSSDGASNKDLSGTTLVLYNSIPDTAGAFTFRTAAGAASTKTIAQSFGAYDGGRKARVRYDTPSFNGVQVSVSYGEELLAENVDESVTDIALAYSGQVGSVTLAGGLAYSRAEFGGGATIENTIGSFSLLHDTGFNVSVAAGSRNNAGHYAYGKLGYKANWIAAGSTAFGIDYYSGQDKTSVGSQSNSVGIGVVQSFDKQNVEAYLAYRQYSLSETAVDYQDAASVMLGARFGF
jgi:hypothetical protein